MKIHHRMKQVQQSFLGVFTLLGNFNQRMDGALVNE